MTLSLFAISLIIFIFINNFSNKIKKEVLINLNENIESEYNFNNLTKNTFKLDSLEIASADFDSAYSWKEANEICTKLGNGWRLPQLDELKIIFKNRREIGGFKTQKYWTSDIHTERTTAFEIYFNYQGFQDVSPITYKLNVRAVKTILPIRN